MMTPLRRLIYSFLIVFFKKVAIFFFFGHDVGHLVTAWMCALCLSRIVFCAAMLFYADLQRGLTLLVVDFYKKKRYNRNYLCLCL